MACAPCARRERLHEKLLATDATLADTAPATGTGGTDSETQPIPETLEASR